jgi:hypothetical protein
MPLAFITPLLTLLITLIIDIFIAIVSQRYAIDIAAIDAIIDIIAIAIIYAG